MSSRNPVLIAGSGVLVEVLIGVTVSDSVLPKEGLLLQEVTKKAWEKRPTLTVATGATPPTGITVTRRQDSELAGGGRLRPGTPRGLALVTARHHGHELVHRVLVRRERARLRVV